MSNGIDNIYDTSDVRRQLAEIAQEREELLADKAQRKKDVTGVGINALKYWQSSQKEKTAELLTLKDQGKEVFEWNPEYMEKSGLERFFTKAHKIVSAIQVDPPGVGARSSEYLKANPQLQDPNTIGKRVSQGAKDISESSEKFFGTDLGQLMSIASVGKGIVDVFNPDFKKSICI